MSNFEYIPEGIALDSHVFYTTEHMFMYVKACTFKDKEAMQKIVTAKTPREAKEIGRSVKNFNSEIWDLHKYSVMFAANMLKYQASPILRQKLLATANLTLVEANPRDLIWSCGLSADNPDIFNVSKWTGQNLLGDVLMQVRKELTL
jgi:ribA/ribD-fused uncharacterized protein